MRDATAIGMCATALSRVKLMQTCMKRGDARVSRLLADLDKTRTELVIILDRLNREQ